MEGPEAGEKCWLACLKAMKMKFDCRVFGELRWCSPPLLSADDSHSISINILITSRLVSLCSGIIKLIERLELHIGTISPATQGASVECLDCGPLLATPSSTPTTAGIQSLMSVQALIGNKYICTLLILQSRQTHRCEVAGSFPRRSITTTSSCRLHCLL